MLKFICPICEIETDETELMPGGEAHLKRVGPGSSDQNFYTYLFERKNLEVFILKDGCTPTAVVNGFMLQDVLKLWKFLGHIVLKK